MRHAAIVRSHGEKQTLGTIQTYEPNNFSGFTLELPWKDNKPDVSCIPDGNYTCRYTQSVRLTEKAGHPVWTYEVLGVPDRSGIRIHSANFFHQLLGCISPGKSELDIDGDGELDMAQSRDAVRELEIAMNHEDFLLHITTMLP